MNASSPKSTTTASKLLGSAEALAALDRLRRSVRELVTRAGQLEADFTVRSGKLRAQFEQALAEERARWTSESESGKTSATEQRASADSVFNRRKARIARALESTRKRKLAEIEAAEGRRTFEVQRDLLEADRVRETDTQKNKIGQETFTTQLANERAALEQLSARARATLAGYRSLAKWIAKPPAVPKLDLTPNEHLLIEQLRVQRDLADRELARCRLLVVPVVFRFLPIWLCAGLIVLVPFALVPALRRFDFQTVPTNVWAIMGACLGGVFVLYWLGKRLAAPHAEAASQALDSARQLAETCAQKADASFQAETERIRLAHSGTIQARNADWRKIQAEARGSRNVCTGRLYEKARRINTRNEEFKRRWFVVLAADFTEHAARLDQATTSRRTQLEAGFNENLAKLNAARDAGRHAIETEWHNVVLPLCEMLQDAGTGAERVFPPWRPDHWTNFSLPEEFTHAARFAELAVDVEKFCEVSLAGKGLTLPGPPQFTVPLLLSVPQQASVLFETRQSGQEQIIGALNNLVLRLLTSAPPGRLAFTIFDPVGLGQNFAGIMHLADFEERLINGRIWTQQPQFEQRLADLNEHIEKVTQMYLRNEYETLAEYNAQAGRLAEKYHFLVIADFPANFSEVAVKRLQSIAASGPRCGVHLLIHWDQRKAAPVEFAPDDLRKNAIRIVPKGEGFAIASGPADAPERRSPTRPVSEDASQRAGSETGAPPLGLASWEGVTLHLDSPPEPELATKLLHQIGKDSTDAYRVEMPFVEVAPEEEAMWSLDTTSELRVPVGRTGATKLQYLALGQGTRQHGLVAGKTGSGKSTLFHVIITNLALWCSPEQVEFYLVDFKKGVEFKCYATQKLPHARVIAIESDREFGLSVLQRVDEELKRRGDLFRKLGAQDVAGYKRAVSGTGVPPVRTGDETPGQDARATPEPMPRVLLLIDEFQELFVEDDRISQGAALLLDRIVRQGRAFGIHVLLGSQTLGGAYTLARATIGQMVVRIALQCNEADAYLIMNEDNPAPRLLSRPGEAIYNDDGGALQGNSPFQVVWLPDQTRDEWLAKVRAFAERRAPALRVSTDQRAELELRAPSREPIVFEGNAPANIRDNTLMRALLEAEKVPATSTPRIFLGAPNSIKGPTEAVFRRASGSHLLIVGQREEAALGMLAVALVSFAAQYPKNSARFLVFDCSPPDSPEAKFLEQAIRAVPHEARLVHPGEVDEVMNALAADQQQRADAAGAAGPETYLLIHGLQRNKKLRFDEEMSFSLDPGAGANPGLQLNKLVCEGASLGFHVLATCDTYNNVLRFLSRKALSEFEMRVVFQMSANDSASLIDSSQANNLGLHRALLFNGHEGWLETFRPYALPDAVWLEEAREKLARKQA